MTTHSPSQQRSRVPNGAAKQRVVVALNEEVLDQIKNEAEQNFRTVSAMASLIIANHYGKNLTASASPSPTSPAEAFSSGEAPASPAGLSTLAA